MKLDHIAPWALLAVLTGCAVLQADFVAPQLSVVNVELLKSDLWSQRMKVRLRVQNPNDRRLPVKGLAYSLQIAGEEIASGVSGASFVVPAQGEAEFDTTVTTNMAGALFKLLGRNSTDRVDYRISGKVALSAGMLRSIPFDQRGTFKLQ